MKKLFTKEVKIGISVIVAIAVLVFGIDYLKGINVFKASNYYYATYNNVEGLELSAPVSLNGFKVGQVRDVSYDFEHPGNVKVELSLDKELKLPEGTKAILGTDLLGTATIMLQLGQGTQYHKVGDQLIAENRAGMIDAVGSQLMPAVSQIFPKIDTLLTAVNMLVSDPALKASVQRLDAITADLQRTTQSVAKMAQQMAPLPGQLTPILTDVKTITGNVGNITGDVNTLSAQLREMPLDSLVADLQTTTENLRLLSEQLNDPNSSLGLLMKDPALYNNINNTVVSLDSLFIDIKKNPKRYINVKVF